MTHLLKRDQTEQLSPRVRELDTLLEHANMKLLEQTNSAKTYCKNSVVVKQAEGSANSLGKQERLLKICSRFVDDVAIAEVMWRRARDGENALLGEAAGQVQPAQNL